MIFVWSFTGEKNIFDKTRESLETSTPLTLF